MAESGGLLNALLGMGPPMMGDEPDLSPRIKKKKPKNVLRFADGTSLNIDPVKWPASRQGELQEWTDRYAKENETELSMVDIDGMEDFSTPVVNPFANTGLSGDPGGGLIKKAGNVAFNMMTGGGGIDKDHAFDMSNFTQEPQFKERDVRTALDIVGTEGGATALPAAASRAIGTARATKNPALTTTALIGTAGLGGMLGEMGMNTAEEMMGIEPRVEDPAGVFIREAAYETFGRTLFGGAQKLWRGAKSLGKHAPEAVKRRADELREFDIRPYLWQVIEPGGAVDSLRVWVSKNPITSGAFSRALEKQYDNVSKMVYKDTDVLVDKIKRAPTKTTAGTAITEGLERFDEDFVQKGTALYDDVWRQLPEDARIPWSKTAKFFEGAASTDPILGSVASPKVNQIARAFESELTDIVKLYGPKGEDISFRTIEDIGLQQARALRTAIGAKIADWTPDADLPIKELKRLYGALSDDIGAGVKLRGGPDAAESFRVANDYWSTNMKNQEDFMSEIYKALGGDPTRALDKASDLVSNNRAPSLKELRRRLGGDAPKGSREWDHFRNMVLRKHIAPSADLPDRMLWASKYKTFREGMDSEVEDLIIGKKGSASREHWDAFYRIAKEHDEIFNIHKAADPGGRFTRAELAGPSAALAGGGMIGYQGSDGNLKDTAMGAGAGLVVGLGLSVLTARSAWKLISNPDVVSIIEKAQRSPDVSMPAVIARIAGVYPSMDYEGKLAIQEYLGALTELAMPENYEATMQQSGMTPPPPVPLPTPTQAGR